jgi:hypothetical protein
LSFNYFGLVFPIDEKENNDATFAGEKKEDSEFNSSSGWLSLSLSEWVATVICLDSVFIIIGLGLLTFQLEKHYLHPNYLCYCLDSLPIELR